MKQLSIFIKVNFSIIALPQKNSRTTKLTYLLLALSPLVDQ